MNEIDIRCLKNLLYCIHELASFEIQQKVWACKINEWVSSYYEVMCTLYDDCAFEDYYLKHNEFQKYGYSKRLIMLFNEFNKEVKEFEEKKEPDEWEEKCQYFKFWNDVQWIRISKLAKSLLKEWGKEEPLVYETLKSVIEEERKYGIYEDSSSYFN